MDHPPTIRDVAAAAGVSRASAQRALANDPHCSEATRSKVLAAAQSLGYRPDPVFASMGSRRRKGTGHGLPIAYLDCATAPGAEHADAARVRAAELGYELRVVTCESYGAERFFDVLYAQGFVGLLTGRLKTDWYPILETNRLFPIVSCGRAQSLPFNTVRGSNVVGVMSAWRQILAKGYRRIGAAFFRHEPAIDDDYAREAAVLFCQKEWGQRGDAIPVHGAPLDDEAAFQKWMESHQPEVVLGLTPVYFYRLLQMGFRIPDQVAFVSLQVLPQQEMIPGIAGLDPLTDRVGVAAVNMLDQMIRHGERGVPDVPMVLTFEPQWVDGTSLPPRQQIAVPKTRRTKPSTKK